MSPAPTALRADAASCDQERILVFPAGLPDAQRYRQEALAAGRQLIGASSLAFDPAASGYEQWARLPYAHEPDFAAALGELIRHHGVTAIYAPHQVVSGVLAQLLPDIAPEVELVAPDPALGIEAAYRRSLDRAQSVAFTCGSGGGPALPPFARAGLARLVDTIPGMTDLDKIDAVIEVMRHVPSGDVVEIGSWWGRSAALLLLLARRYGVGPVLCIDPWRNDCLGQGVAALDQASAQVDADQALTIFQMNLSPLACGDLNYLRAPSCEAAPLYRPGLTVSTDAFGQTRYRGEIALLHVDGNHAYEQAETDVRLWAPYVRPGGWIIIDDYVWAFGDGPRRVGDAFLNDNADRIDLSFVMGTALFVHLADA